MPEDYEEEQQNDEETVYGEGREVLTDNDEISPEEEAFMAGYEDEEHKDEKEKNGDKAYEAAFDD